MAKSKAKKMREKLEREGLRNPEEDRVSWGDQYFERKTKTKQEKINKEMNKYKNFY